DASPPSRAIDNPLWSLERPGSGFARGPRFFRGQSDVKQVGTAGWCVARRGVGELRIGCSSALLRNGPGGPQVFSDGSHKAEALPGEGLDQALLLTGVADRGPGHVDACIERGLRHNPALPD